MTEAYTAGWLNILQGLDFKPFLKEFSVQACEDYTGSANDVVQQARLQGEQMRLRWALTWLVPGISNRPKTGLPRASSLV